MTKTTLILPEQTEPKLEFPLLAQHEMGAICQFRTETEARLLIGSAGEQATGNAANWDTWTPVTKKETWTILPKGSKIVIEQI